MAVLNTDSIIGPRPISDNEIERRIDWRNKYKFVETGTNWGVLAILGAVAAAIVGILVWSAKDDDNRPPPPPPPPPPTRHWT